MLTFSRIDQKFLQDVVQMLHSWCNKSWTTSLLFVFLSACDCRGRYHCSMSSKLLTRYITCVDAVAIMYVGEDTQPYALYPKRWQKSKMRLDWGYWMDDRCRRTCNKASLWRIATEYNDEMSQSNINFREKVKDLWISIYFYKHMSLIEVNEFQRDINRIYHPLFGESWCWHI